jgi:hypothetical protein
VDVAEEEVEGECSYEHVWQVRADLEASKRSRSGDVRGPYTARPGRGGGGGGDPPPPPPPHTLRSISIEC